MKQRGPGPRLEILRSGHPAKPKAHFSEGPTGVGIGGNHSQSCRWLLAWLAIALFMTVVPSSRGQITTNNFYNWETSPVHPVGLSPDHTRLVVCNLPDNRLEVFDVTSGQPVSIGSIPVGLDPVTARFRTGSEIWVANYISGSISVVNLATMRVVNTITTSNEPSDIVFAGVPQRAYVSCGQPNLVQVFDTSSQLAVTNLVIDGDRPRAMDVSPDGSKVYVAIFESGNASTIIGTGVTELNSLPKPTAIDFTNAPSRGLNPPPNNGTNFVPAINRLITNPPPPHVSLIVKKNSAGRWMDDNNGDWTEYIRGTNAAFTGRLPGWDMPDHDLAIINTPNFSITYATGLMNICMAVAVNPASGKVAVVGTEALNSIRFQPVLFGTFIRVHMAQVDPAALTNAIVDLNSHLTYQVPQVSDTDRDKSIGDPRGIIWSSDGSRGYVTGMGSDNLIIIDAQGNRAGINPAIHVGQGPTGMALDETHQRLYVYNRFDGSISTVDTAGQTVIATLQMFDPTPQQIKLGRPFLYNTHMFSGLGQLACGSCHVDSRFDRLAWDLGDPTDVINTTPRNTVDVSTLVSTSFHPMKGPMTTQTLQDIIGHEPFHWRGDRDGIEKFDVTFTNLQAGPVGITTNQMLEFKNFLATVRFAPNPFRQFDNSLSTNLPLPGQFALGRGTLPAGAQLPNGNAQNGQRTFQNTNDSANACIECHSSPTGLGSDMRFVGVWIPVPVGSNSAHHVAMVSLPRASNLPFKVPQLRNMFDKFGMDLTQTNSRAGFGFSHDGSVDTLTRFVQDGFGFTDDQQTADLIAFLLSLTGSDLIINATNDSNRSPGLPGLDTAAAVGRQITINNSASVALINTMIAMATSATGRVDLVVKGWESGLPRGWFYDSTRSLFQSDRQAETETATALRALAAVGSEQTYTLVPRGTGRRIGIDRNADGFLDRDVLDFKITAFNVTSSGTTVSWVSVSNFTYQLQYKANLTDPAWTTVPGNVVASGTTASQTDATAPTNSSRFYRILALP
jgi:YVTN family beta-propeller protein